MKNFYRREYFKKALEYVLEKGSCSLIEILRYLEMFGVDKLECLNIANALFENPMIYSDGEMFYDEALKGSAV